MIVSKTWEPFAIFKTYGDGYSYAILILNRPITVPLKKYHFLQLWENASVRVTVDGGTDRWLSWKEEHYPNTDIKSPDLITGDMDSIKKETLEKYKQYGNVKVVVTADQNETDYTKALRELEKYVDIHDMQLKCVITITEETGRFDQIIANINTLYKARDILPYIDVFLLSTESLSWLLQTADHTIYIPQNVLRYSKWCALIPFGSSARVTTTGLKWNLSNTLLEFGNLVSTSNVLADTDKVTVRTDTPIVWSIEVNVKMFQCEV